MDDFTLGCFIKGMDHSLLSRVCLAGHPTKSIVMYTRLIIQKELINLETYKSKLLKLEHLLTRVIITYESQKVPPDKSE